MEPFSFASAASTFLEAIRLVGKLFRRILDRNMQVDVSGWYPDMKPIYSVVILWKDPEGRVSVVEHPNIYGMFMLTLINHRTDRKERLLNARLVLESGFLFWRRVLASAPVQIHGGSGRDRPFENIVLEPQSAPHKYTVIAHGPITYPVATFPRRSKLSLELNFVGPMRRMRRVLSSIKHDPQAVHKAEHQPRVVS